MGSMPLVLVLPLASLLGCSAPPRSPPHPAGSDIDDGNGDLARKSAHLLTSDDTAPPRSPRRRGRRVPDGDPYGGNPYGGDAYRDPDGDTDTSGSAGTASCANLGRCGNITLSPPTST